METKENKMQQTINIEKLWDHKVVQIILSVIFGISTASLTFFLIQSKFANIYIYITLPICSFILSQILVWKYDFLKNIFKGKPIQYWIITLFLSIFWSRYTHVSGQQESIIASIMAVPACSVYIYWFYQKVWYYLKAYIQSLDTIEKRYMIGLGITLTVGVVILYNLTNVFSTAQVHEEKYQTQVMGIENLTERIEIPSEFIQFLYNFWNCDSIYTTDTAKVLREDVFFNIHSNENDIRQPLFGLFAVPFHIVPKMIATLIPQITNLYPILLVITQGILISIAFVLLARMMQLKGFSKILFLLFITCSYPTLLFILNIEQYVMSVFYMIVCIYMVMQKLPEQKIAYIAAAGSMLTSAIWLPLLGANQNWKDGIKNIGKTIVLAIAIAIVSARIVLVLPIGIQEQISTVTLFSDGATYTAIEKMAMYTNFIYNTIFSGEHFVEHITAAGQVIPYTCNGQEVFISILIPTLKVANTTQFNIVGWFIIGVVIVGFWLNRKDAFSKICFAWFAFSFLLLYVLGWGTVENGLILYTFYFSWAILCLLYKLLEKICGKHKNIQYTITIALIGTMILVNGCGIWQVIQFGLQYFYC